MQRHQAVSPRQPTPYVSLDVHKLAISYCVKDGSGAILADWTIPATRFDTGPLDENAAPAMDRSPASGIST